MKIHARDMSLTVKGLGVFMAISACIAAGLGYWKISAQETFNYILAMQLSVLPIDISKIKTAGKQNDKV